MKLIFGLMALLISKICVIGQHQTHMCFKRLHYNHKKWACGVDFIPEVLLENIFSSMKMIAMLRSMEFAIMPCWKTIFGQNWMDLTSVICDSNKMVPHATQLVKQLIYWRGSSVFGNRVISRNGPIAFDRTGPPRSYDLTPLDFFLWGYVESLIYANKPTTLEELRDNIESEIANVPVDMCERVVENWLQRIDHCKRARGGHMNEIEFHS